MIHYDNRRVRVAVDAITTLLASMVVSLSTLCLYLIPSTGGRVGALIAFTIAFSVLMMLFAGGSRAECFMATSAYAAVLVVFIGGTGGV